ncbi:MAG TPA: HTTM domain-containing protein [Gemmataceae bacterium]
MRTFSTRLDPATPRGGPPADSDAGLIALLSRFLFNPADPTTLGLIRICAGLVVLYVHLVYVFNLQDYFGENGWYSLSTATEFRKEFPVGPPRASSQTDDPYASLAGTSDTPERRAYRLKWDIDPALLIDQGYQTWSIWFHVTDPIWMTIITIAMLVVMVLFTLGVCTRVTSALTWMSALFFIHRNTTILYGMDSIMSVLLLYLMIGPSGAALSVDRWLARRWKAKRTGQKVGGILDGAAPAPSVGANFALRLMQIHYCIIYFASGTSKLQGPAWWGGTALWFVYANPEFAPMHLRLYKEFVFYLADHLWVRETFLAVGAASTIVLELSLPFLIWIRRWRPYMIAAAVLLHAGIGVIMGLTTFSLLMLCLLLAFIPGEAVRRAIRLSVDWLRGEDLKARSQGASAAGELTLQHQ